MNTRPHHSPARVAGRLVIGCLLLLALLPPALVAVVGWTLEQRAVEHDTALVAMGWRGTEPVAAESRLKALLAELRPGERPGWIALSNAAGAVSAQAGAEPAWPSLQATRRLSASGPVNNDGDLLTQVKAARPLQPVLSAAAFAGLASGALTLALWWLVFRRPVSVLSRAEGRIRSFARTDPLTGLLNREGLRERIARSFTRAGPRTTTAGLLLIDLDRFNLFNGTLGQAGGDSLLRSVTERLRSVVRESDALARLGGDQFVVLVERISTPQVLMAMARNLQRAFETPFVVDGREIVVSFSAGAVLADEATATADDLLRRAGAAMRAAKAAGGMRCRQYDGAMDDGADSGLLDMDLQLRRALSAGQFFLVYQPIVEPHSRRVVAVEALLRWATPDRGVVSPVEFIPVLEQTGLIVPVGRWVLQEACRQAAAWHRDGASELLLSVNVSPRQFAEPDFVQRLRHVLSASGFPARCLQLEVTEGLLLEPTPGTLQRIDELAAMGVRLAVDDFGMGYSSLAYLKRFALHGLKIDRLFVKDIAEREQDLAIVRAIVDLGHGLGLHVTAEGVETEAQCEALCAVGCDALQGFLFARPAVADDVRLADAVGALPAQAEPLVLEAARV